MSDRMERARELMRANNFVPQPHVLALMLDFADAELERAALAVANLAYRVRHPSAGMDHEMEMYDDGCKDAATTIRNMKEE